MISFILKSHLVYVGRLNKAAFVPAGQQDNLAFSHSEEDAAACAADFGVGRAGANVLPVLQGYLTAI